MASSTVASLENIRKQRQLEMELVELDRQKDMELKALNQERLALLKELCRMRQDKRKAQHLPRSTRGIRLTLMADTAQARLLRAKEAKELHKFDFKPDPVDRVQVQLPALSKGGPLAQFRSAREMYNHRVHVQKSTLENYMQDRRSRRRAFLDKSLINPRIKSQQRDSLLGFTAILRPKGADPPGKVLGILEERGEEFLRKERVGSSPGFPALGTGPRRRSDGVKAGHRQSGASVDNHNVKDTASGQQEVVTSQKAPAASVTSLPPVDKS